jgi:signal transduction histidine kinase
MHAIAAACQRFMESARRHPTVVDAALAMAVLAFTVPQLAYWARQPDGLWVRLVLTVLLLAPIAWRRRFPLQTFAFACSVALIQWALNVTLAADVALLVYLYTVASRRRAPVALLAAAVLEIGVVLAAVRWNLAGTWAQPLAERLVFLTAMVAVALLLGISVRVRRQAIDALTDRAARLERERDQQVALATAAERARIARDLHDVVAHSLSVMVTLSDAAALKAGSDPATAERTMQQVSATGRQSLTEMRRLLGILRADADAPRRDPQPGLAALDELADQVRATGIAVTLAVVGSRTALSPGVELTTYRVVQEAATNVLKHAESPTRLDVEIELRPDAVVIDVRDDGAPCGPSRPTDGLGLFGMRERVASYGGEVDAGPMPDGGWWVRAVLPMIGDRARGSLDA